MSKEKMKHYILGFCTSDADILDDPNNRRYWRCQAEDEAHAYEQLLNAEPLTNWYEVIEVTV